MKVAEQPHQSNLNAIPEVGLVEEGTSSETPDTALMERYREGDADAFAVLYQRHKGALYRYILRLCGNESISEELFQEVWMKLINARKRYEVKAKFTTYLFQIAHNRVIDHYRRRQQLNPGNYEAEIESVPTRIQDQPEQQLESHEQSQNILSLIDKLPVEQREVFLLKEEAGKSIPEIAEITGVNAETAKSRLRYAVNKLRQALKN